jgi:hypothetical protein
MSFAQPDISPADKSPAGLLGKHHPGSLVNMKNTNGLIMGTSGSAWPRPSYVAAPLFPSSLVTPRTQPKIGLPASALPTPPATGGALITADDFSDGWNTFAFDNGVEKLDASNVIPQLGPTKYGTILPYSLQTHCYTTIVTSAPWGTDNSGNAVLISSTPGAASVDLGVADFNVMVERVGPAADNGTNGETGLVFRRQDENNMFIAKAVYNPFDDEKMYIVGYKIINGVENDFDGSISFIHIAPNDTWHWLRVKAKGTTFQIFIDDGGSGWTQIGSDITGQTTHQAETQAGLLAWAVSISRQSTRQRTASLRFDTAP